MTIKEVSQILRKDPAWVRAGLIEGWLPFGFATREGKKMTNINEMDIRKGRISYFINENEFKKWRNVND